jgi:DNA invertase Pin-like site-specific DNA recombinase
MSSVILGINFISYDNNLDITTPTGKLVFQIIGAIAEFEKDIIRERVVAGLENAKQKGKQLGRSKIYDAILEKAKKLRKQGMSFRKIEKQLGVGEGTIRKKINSQSNFSDLRLNN